MNKKELFIAGALTVLIAFMDISGLPCALFVNIKVSDIEPIYWTLNFYRYCRVSCFKISLS